MTTDPRLPAAEQWLLSWHFHTEPAKELAPRFLATIDVYDPLRQPVDGDVVERMLTFMAEVGRAREMTAEPILAVFADGSTRPVLSGPDSVPVTAATAGGIILDLQDRISELEGLTAPPAAPAQSSEADAGAQATGDAWRCADCDTRLVEIASYIEGATAWRCPSCGLEHTDIPVGHPLTKEYQDAATRMLRERGITGDAHKAPVAALTTLRDAFPPGAERVILSGAALEAVVDAIGTVEDASVADDKFLDSALLEATARPWWRAVWLPPISFPEWSVSLPDEAENVSILVYWSDTKNITTGGFPRGRNLPNGIRAWCPLPAPPSF